MKKNDVTFAAHRLVCEVISPFFILPLLYNNTIQ